MITSLPTSNPVQCHDSSIAEGFSALTYDGDEDSDSGLLVVTGLIKSAGINRHVVGNERVLQGRR
jgi:hypothetical protein